MGCILAMLAMVCLPAGAKKVEAATSKKVTLTLMSYDGKKTVLKKTVNKGTRMTLPDTPDIKNYYGVGWARQARETKAKYPIGKKFNITGNLKLYAVYKKYPCAVGFTNNKGTSRAAAYKSLGEYVAKNTKFKLPAVPEVDGYISVGWTTSKGKTTPLYKAGTKVKITKSTWFYAVYKKDTRVKLVLHTPTGAHYKTLTVNKGSYVELPAVKNNSTNAFMGWSTKKNQSVNPTYEAGEKFLITKETHLYGVLYKKSSEPNLTASQITAPNLNKYSKIIFVGDSRMNRVMLTMQNQFGNRFANGVSFICKENSGLTWLKSEGYQQLMYELNHGGAGTKKKPTAIVFNSGVNDLYNVSAYMKFMKKIAPELQAKNCELFYMSINPFNDAQMRAAGKRIRSEQELWNFNMSIRYSLRGTYTFIDTNTWMLKNGYTTDRGKGVDINVDDGLHYSTRTNKRLYSYCMAFLNKA